MLADVKALCNEGGFNLTKLGYTSRKVKPSLKKIA